MPDTAAFFGPFPSYSVSIYLRSLEKCGLEDVTRFPYLIAELLRRGYTDEDVKKIAGLNLIRAMREMELAAERLDRE